MYLLDTDICSYILKEKPASVREKFQQVNSESLHVSVITCAELLYGVRRSASAVINESVVLDFLSRLTVLHWTMDAASSYGSLRVALESKGDVIGNMDMLIAAHALSVKFTVVTNNLPHFSKVPGLLVENWTR